MSEKYEFIDAEYATMPAEGDAPVVMQMCEWLGVSKSGFYDWRTRPQSETAQRRELLEIKIKALFEANNSEYGYRRIHAALVRGGESVDDETVRKIMRDLGLEPCQPRPWRFSLTEQDGQAGPIPDLVNRDFTASKPGEKNGRGYHVYRYVGRLGLSRDGHRLRNPENRRVGDGRQLQDPAHFQRDRDGRP